jgi:hypothetical protein
VLLQVCAVFAGNGDGFLAGFVAGHGGHAGGANYEAAAFERRDLHAQFRRQPRFAERFSERAAAGIAGADEQHFPSQIRSPQRPVTIRLFAPDASLQNERSTGDFPLRSEFDTDETAITCRRCSTAICQCE